jgi:hypothetical protein
MYSSPQVVASFDAEELLGQAYGHWHKFDGGNGSGSEEDD